MNDDKSEVQIQPIKMEFPNGRVPGLGRMSGSQTMSKNMVSSELYELVSDVKEEIIYSGDERENTFGGPQQEHAQFERNSYSALELEEFDRDTFQIKTSSIEDEIDIKYEVNGIEHTSTSHAEDDLGSGPILSKPLKLESINSEEKELNQLYLDLLQCERDCDTCQKYIRILKEHVRTTHAKDEPTLDPLEIDPLDMNLLSAIEVKCEGDEEMKTMGCSEESDSNFELEIESHNGSDPEYKANQSSVNGMKCDAVKKTEMMDCSSEDTDSSSDYEGEGESESDADSNSPPELKRKPKSDEKLGKDNGKKPFKCEFCDMSFTKKSVLSVHFRSHTGEKHFKCEECSQAFSRNNSLNIHMRTHTGVGLFKCKECEKSFTTRSRLTFHFRSHTGEKPFKCEECGQAFARNNSLNVHMRIHTGVGLFKCEECEKSFTLRSRLSKHLRTHTGDRSHKCEQCEKCFTTKRGLTMHMMSHTGEGNRP